MKKLAFSVLAIALSFGFFACQQESSSDNNEAEKVSEVADKTPTAPETTPPPVTRPEWQEKAEKMERTTVEFAKEEYDYGKVQSGEKVTYKFKFKNTGDKPFQITNVKPSCGCTTPSYSTAPVAPGEEGHIDVEFDTTGKQGRQIKTITVTGNFDGQITRTLKISGEVTPPSN
ncbi:MAG: DUF1573 domain-containing protein [Bacteroidetes bacterium]|nr:MAG: DUF1573 domain-containing protein [Bacteroidota bacterium]